MADGVELFFVVDAQGEEVNAVARLFGSRSGDEHDGLAVADQAAAVGKAGHFAGLDDHRAAADFGLERVRMELHFCDHGLNHPFLFGLAGASPAQRAH